ncbi:hypothetical protein, partial [Sodalis sp.]|uniref:hypothetical protein n=1 Tax=Sodalis sp. (in: enterobacteria) TaxID=1898979 RepID=UPI003873BD1B
ILEQTGSKLMGRYEEGFLLSLLGFGIISMWEYFHCNGNLVVLSIELKTVVRKTIAFLGICWSSSAVIRSCPGDFLLGNFLISKRTSDG